MAKLRPVESNGVIKGYHFDCPGCGKQQGGGHYIVVRPHQLSNGASWEFNGDIDRPTFSPSILSKIEFTLGSGKPTVICHCIVMDGVIEFLGDCTHHLAGEKVEMFDVEIGD